MMIFQDGCVSIHFIGPSCYMTSLLFKLSTPFKKSIFISLFGKKLRNLCVWGLEFVTFNILLQDKAVLKLINNKKRC